MSYPFASISFTTPLAFPKSMRPAYLPRNTPITLPMSFIEAAPVSAMAASTAARVSASSSGRGRKPWMISASSRSWAAS